MIHCSVQGLIKFSFFFFYHFTGSRERKNGKNSLSKINLSCTAGTCWIYLSVHSVCGFKLSWFLLLRGVCWILESFLSFPTPCSFLLVPPPIYFIILNFFVLTYPTRRDEDLKYVNFLNEIHVLCSFLRLIILHLRIIFFFIGMTWIRYIKRHSKILDFG